MFLNDKFIQVYSDNKNGIDADSSLYFKQLCPMYNHYTIRMYKLLQFLCCCGYNICPLELKENMKWEVFTQSRRWYMCF